MTVSVLGVSLLFMLIATALQWYVEYRREMVAIEAQFDAIRSSYLGGLTQSVWTYDEILLQTQLDGLSHLPDIAFLEVQTTEGRTYTVGQRPAPDLALSRIYPMEYLTRGQALTLGHLEVVSSLAGPNARVLGHLGLALTTQTVLIFLLAGFILLISQALITHPLKTIARYTQEIKLEHADQPLRLERRWGTPYDELSQVADALNEMRERLTRDAAFRRQAEETLRQNQQMLAHIFNTVPQAIFWKDRQCIYLGCNAVFAQAAGLPSPEAVVGKTDFDLPWTKIEAEAYRADDQRVMTTGLPLRHREEPLQQFDGTRIWINTSKVPLVDDTGSIYGVLGIYDDITRRKQVEEEIMALNADLECRVAARTAELAAQSAELAARSAELSVINADLSRALRARDDFLATMSHELRTPLTGILGLSEALALEVYGSLSEKQRRPMEMIHTSGEHLLELINDILDLSKIDAGGLTLVQTPVSVAELCQASVQLVAESAQKKKLKLQVSTDLAVTSVLADERRLKQMLVNLLSNAIKFTPAGGAIGLTVTGNPERQVVRFEVWDTGIGIAPEDLPRLFKPFVQLDSRLARQYEGSGLGLVLVQRLADMHGGSVTVESTPGQGSHFRLSLPWVSASDPEAATPARLAAPALPAGLRVLLADDSEMTLQLCADYLGELGCQVSLARHGAEAVEQCQVVQPDIILMDIQMPVMDGLEAIRTIRALPGFEAVPIVALTALVMKGDEARCRAAGATDYLSKPVALADLAQGMLKNLRPK
jgi:PAS domain S-box-containing protein